MTTRSVLFPSITAVIRGAAGLMVLTVLLSLCTTTALAQGPAEGTEVGDENDRYTVDPIDGEIEIDGRLAEPAWETATTIRLDHEWFPGDNMPPPVETEALVTFDEENLYVAFRAHDPSPSQIRAHLMDRDEISTFVQDDHVTLMIDPFNDERRAFQFRVNPLGVQADAIFSQVEFVEDFSWDIIWDSAGRITDFGYVVEIAIPFNQIRFPDPGTVQTWGFELGRSYPRGVRHRMSANPRDRDNNCILCQIDKITGFTGMETGLNAEVTPTVTANRTDSRETFPDGDFESGDEDFEPGVTARWGVTSGLTLNATVNPDFSQVEADVAQLEVNERFALFFPEKRPFFLEGIDFFATPIDAVFTRTIVDPAWGLKLSGKQGRHAGGVFVAGDEVNSLVIPSNQGSAFAFSNEEVTAGVLRYRHDIGASSTLGILYTGREGDSEYHNHVGGIDGFFRLSETDELRFQYLRSDTRYSTDIASAFGQPRDSFDDDAFEIEWDHGSRRWSWEVGYEDRGPGFRADSGFVPRVDIRTGDAFLRRIWWGEDADWYTRIDLGGGYSRTEDHEGRLTDEEYELFVNVLGPRQSVVFFEVDNTTRFVRGITYDDLLAGTAFFEIQPGGWGKTSFFGAYGETVDFANNQPADTLLLRPALELKLGRSLNAQLSHALQRLDVAGGELTETNLSQLRLVYNFNVRTFVRLISQFRDVERDPALFDFPVEPDTETLFNQLLFSYKVNPQTVVFVGYSDNHLGLQGVDLTQTDRTYFVKLGYAWIL